MQKTLRLVALFLLIFNIAQAQSPDKIIPLPSSFELTKGTYKFDGEPKIKVKYVKNDCPEGYYMKISPKGITIQASSETGVFYAEQSLRQMTRNGRITELQCCEINDYPRFSYRGMHFDVSRHFRSLDFLKKQVDAMAAFKMNRMHLHLTDGAGWRLQIDAYPRLTSYAAWRPYEKWTDWAENKGYAEEGSGRAFGGYYTKDEMRELIAYAHERHIEVIPEIEMPGHNEEVMAAYPELGCTAGECGDFCVGKEKTFEFLETVLSEVIELFPSEYIHIGGDEAGKGNWKKCPDCQARMRAEGLDNVDELQSYMIERISRFVESKGRKIIGWDEILEGGLAPGATVMSWRGISGGIAAMNMHHDVIMCPGSHCYLDYTQDAPFREPASIGGYLPLAKVYSYEPVSDDMPKDGLHYLKGVQANLWAEYIPTEAHAEYMYWPRAIAIAEIGWSRKEDMNYENFRERVLPVLDLMHEEGYNTFDLANEYGERKLSLTGISHMGKGAKVTYNQPINPNYKGAGEGTLTDGIAGGWANGDGRWQGFLTDLDVTIDLGEVKPVHYVGATFMHITGTWIYMPQYAEIYVSTDGREFKKIATAYNDVAMNCPGLILKIFDTVCNEEARYIRYTARNKSIDGGWIFIDEIVIN